MECSFRSDTVVIQDPQQALKQACVCVVTHALSVRGRVLDDPESWVTMTTEWMGYLTAQGTTPVYSL